MYACATTHAANLLSQICHRKIMYEKIKLAANMHAIWVHSSKNVHTLAKNVEVNRDQFLSFEVVFL